MKDKLIIIGAGETSEIAYEYFSHDSQYNVIAFSVEKAFIKNEELFDLPVVPFEELENIYSNKDCMVFVAVSFTQLNRIRTKLYLKAKEKGFSFASYVSSKAFIWHNVEVGENSFIFENNVIQHKVKIGNNVIIWSGNHIGHQTVIKDNCYISSHCVISGFCEIGKNCFLGVNSTFNDCIKIAEDCVIGSGAVVIRNTKAGRVYIGNPAKESGKSSFEAFNVEDK